MNITVAGENALIVYFGQRATPETAAKVSQATQQLRQCLQPVLIDLIASYVSVLIVFDITKINHYQLRKQVKKALGSDTIEQQLVGKLIELPVYYGAEAAPDLAALAKHSGLDPEQVISTHQSIEYLVYAIGFAPGFAFLGEVDKSIAMPRRATPRKQVEKGSVAIADQQTAVYPAASPGGWNLIGQCPAELFNPNIKPAMPFAVGDRVRFVSISRDEFFALGGTLGRCTD